MRELTEGMKMTDSIEVIGKGSLIQHGKHNDRVYLMKLDERDGDTIIPEISKLAGKNSYSKIFCKVPKDMAPLFFANAYILEGFIPGFYNGEKDAFFVSRFLDSDRLLNIEKNQLTLLSQQLSRKPKKKTNSTDYTIRKLDKSDVAAISSLYSRVFDTYPFPIHKPEYILKTMEENLQYFGAEINGELAALSSAEIDFTAQNAEMTDFATKPGHLGNNLSAILLKVMEIEMKKQGIITLYTIARLNSIPMNKTFLQNEYNYSGTLINNTNIAGRIESMNIYYKQI